MRSIWQLLRRFVHWPDYVIYNANEDTFVAHHGGYGPLAQAEWFSDRRDAEVVARLLSYFHQEDHMVLDRRGLRWVQQVRPHPSYLKAVQTHG